MYISPPPSPIRHSHTPHPHTFTGWCTYYTCLKRLSTFFSLVAVGTDYCVWMTGSPPSHLRFHLLNAGQDDAIKLCVWFKTTQRKDVYKVKSVVLATLTNICFSLSTTHTSYTLTHTHTHTHKHAQAHAHTPTHHTSLYIFYIPCTLHKHKEHTNITNTQIHVHTHHITHSP